MRKILSLVLVVMMMFGCVSAVSAEEATGSNVLTMAMGLNPNLDIHWNAGTTGAMLINRMYEGLYRYTSTGFELAGAESVETSEDGLTWTFKLRQDAKWSDGKPVTAADYVYSMQRLVNPEVGSTYMDIYGSFLKNGAKISAGELPLEELGVRPLTTTPWKFSWRMCAASWMRCCATPPSSRCAATWWLKTAPATGLGKWSAPSPTAR